RLVKSAALSIEPESALLVLASSRSRVHQRTIGTISVVERYGSDLRHILFKTGIFEPAADPRRGGYPHGCGSIESGTARTSAEGEPLAAAFAQAVGEDWIESTVESSVPCRGAEVVLRASPHNPAGASGTAALERAVNVRPGSLAGGG